MEYDVRYNEIIKKYGIEPNTSLHDIRRILAQKMSEFHPDKNPSKEASKIYFEITNDRDYIIELLHRQKNNRDNPNTNSNSQNNSSHATNNGNNNAYTNSQSNNQKSSSDTNNNPNNNTQSGNFEDFLRELDEYRERYRFIASICRYIDNIKFYRINYIKSIKELNDLKKEIPVVITYYRLRAIIEFNKEEYDNNELTELTALIYKKITKITDKDPQIYSIEKEYYAKFNIIKEKIEKEIAEIKNPIVELINKIEKYDFIELNYLVTNQFHLFNHSNFKSVKKLNEQIESIYQEIRKDFIRFLQQEAFNHKDNNDYCDYINQVLLMVDETRSFDNLHNIMNEFNNKSMHFIDAFKDGIIDEAEKYLSDEDFATSNLLKIHLDKLKETIDKKKIVMTCHQIKNLIFNILKDRFRKKVQSDGLDYNYQFKYISGSYSCKTEEDLNRLINQYNEELLQVKNKFNPNTSSLEELKQNFLNDLIKAKARDYASDAFKYKIQIYINNLNLCNKKTEIINLIKRFEEDLLMEEIRIFYEELTKDNYEYNNFTIYTKYISKLSNIKNLNQLELLRREYMKEMSIFLNIDTHQHHGKN